MFVKSLFLTAVTLSLSLQVHGHATFAPNQAAADAVKRSDIRRAPNPCVAATALKNPIPIDAKGQFVAFARSFNAGKDGATTIKAGQVDASAGGQNFKDGDVTEVSGGVASQPDNKGRQTVTFAMPKGVKCAGGADKSSCLVSLTTSAGFVNCVAVTQAGSNAGSGTKAAAGNKQAASSSSAEATATASDSAASTATSSASETATSTAANPSATETGNAGSDTQASQQVTLALAQVKKIKQELDALIKSLGGNNNNNQANKNTAGQKKADAAKKAAKKAAADKKAKDAQKNASTTSSAASATETSASETATATSSGEVPAETGAETGTPIIGRDLEDDEDNEDDDFSDLDELSTLDLEDDEDVEVEDDEE